MVDRQPCPDGESGDHGYGRNELSRHSTSVPMRRINEASKGYQSSSHPRKPCRTSPMARARRSPCSGTAAANLAASTGSGSLAWGRHLTRLGLSQSLTCQKIRSCATPRSSVLKFRSSCAGGFSSRIEHDEAARATNAGSASSGRCWSRCGPTCPPTIGIEASHLQSAVDVARGYCAPTGRYA